MRNIRTEKGWFVMGKYEYLTSTYNLEGFIKPKSVREIDYNKFIENVNESSLNGILFQMGFDKISFPLEKSSSKYYEAVFHTGENEIIIFEYMSITSKKTIFWITQILGWTIFYLIVFFNSLFFTLKKFIQQRKSKKIKNIINLVF